MLAGANSKMRCAQRKSQEIFNVPTPEPTASSAFASKKSRQCTATANPLIPLDLRDFVLTLTTSPGEYKILMNISTAA
jgi:hypothetical protein